MRRSAIASADSGVCEAGLTIAVLPQASAGAIFQLAITAGKFHGVMRAHTPTGSRRVTSMPGGTIGIVSPVILFAAPPQYSKTFATMSISARAFADRLAAVARLEPRELFLPVPDQERGAREDPASLASAETSPGTVVERSSRDVDGARRVVRVRLRGLPRDGAGGGLEHIGGSTRERGNPLPAEHQQFGHAAPPVT